MRHAAALIALLVFATPHPAAAHTGSACDRDCLRGFIDRYLWSGQIHAVDVFMKVMPQGNPSGWDARP
jgi:hypothetical protein